MNETASLTIPLDISMVVVPSDGNGPDTVYAFSADATRGGALCVRIRSNGYWSLEQDLGGSVRGGIAAAIGSNGAVTVLYPGSAGTLCWQERQADGAWTGEKNFGLSVVGDVAAFTDPGGTLALFYAGADTTLRWLSQSSDGSWGSEQNLGGRVGGAVTVIVPFAAIGTAPMQVFYRGASGEIQWRMQNADGTWPGETGLGGMATDRVAASMLPGTQVLQVFYRDVATNQIETCYRNAAGPWTRPSGLGEALNTNVAVAAVPDSLAVQLFFGGSDNDLYTRWRQADGEWSDHQDLGGIVGCDPVPVVMDGQSAVFYRRTGQSIWYRTRDSGGNWSAETNASPISHVFVLMLENHSFDNIFGRSGIGNLRVAPTTAANSWATEHGAGYCPVGNKAPMFMQYGPEHGFVDTLKQLCGDKAQYPVGGPYPAITTAGFAQDYADRIPTQTDQNVYCQVMQCFDTRNELPVIYALATAFTVCDGWFSSLPSSTWPNRFFLHAASTGGWVDTPNDMLKYYTTGGVKFPNGSVFNAIDDVRLKWRIYNDEDNQFSDDPSPWGLPVSVGNIAQVGSLYGINHVTQVHSLSGFADDLQGDYPYQYTFIEPNYGFEPVTGGSDTQNWGGSSQHPVDDMYGGEGLMSAVYLAIRESPLWESSMLIITYDEHGGFYDSVAPPGGATAPGDGSERVSSENPYGFDFTQYGPRVPAVVISPWTPVGVDHNLYDHSSVPATLSALFGTPSLTGRDLDANHLAQPDLLGLAQPRTDTPSVLPPPTPTGQRRRVTVPPRSDDDPVPQDDTLQGFLGVAVKTRLEICVDDEPARRAHIDELMAIRTRGDARRYLEQTHAMIVAARAAAEP